MPALGVNIDHIATLRQARGGRDPDPIQAAVIAELAGANGITAHLREDRRHMQDKDIYLLKQVVTTHLNLEMAATQEMANVANDVAPYMTTLVPERREERTTEGGLAVAGRERDIAKIVEALQSNNVRVSLFIDPDLQQVKAARKSGASHVELHTGYYANAAVSARDEELIKLRDACLAARKLGLRVNAGHGLNYLNVTAVAAIEGVEELNIGHAIIARAALVGLETAVRDMLMMM
jgi:pyridoxine 5-phosphate synthase